MDPPAPKAQKRKAFQELYSDSVKLSRDDSQATMYHPIVGDTPIKTFKPDKELLNSLQEVDDIDVLKNYIRNVFGKICGYDFFKEELVSLLQTFDRSLTVEVSYNPAVLMSFLKRLLRELVDKIHEVDAKLTDNMPDSAQGSGEVAEVIAKNRKAVKKMIDGLVHRVNEQAAELGILNFHIIDLEKELVAKQTEIEYLKGEKLRDLSDLDEDFIEKMHEQLEISFPKHSSIIETDKMELEELQKMVERYGEELQAANDRILELTSNRSLEIESAEYLVRAITAKISSLTPDENLCRQAAREWFNRLMKIMEQDKDKHEKLLEERQRVLNHVEKVRGWIEEHWEEWAEGKRKVQRLRDQMEELEKERAHFLERMTEAEEDMHIAELNLNERVDMLRRMGHAIDAYIEEFNNAEPREGVSYGSPERDATGSPIIQATPPSFGHSEGPSYGSPIIQATPPSPGRSAVPTFLHSSQKSVGTSTTPYKYFSPEVSPISRQGLFGMTSATPLMDPNVTPVQIWSKPPGDDLDVNMCLRRRIVLPNPGKECPLLVDVGVQPQILTEQDNEGRFVCGITIGLQDAPVPLPTPIVTPGFLPSSTHGSVMRKITHTPRGARAGAFGQVKRRLHPQFDDESSEDVDYSDLSVSDLMSSSASAATPPVLGNSTILWDYQVRPRGVTDKTIGRYPQSPESIGSASPDSSGGNRGFSPVDSSRGVAEKAIGRYPQSPVSIGSASPDSSGGYLRFSPDDSLKGTSGQYSQSPSPIRSTSPGSSGGYRRFSPVDSPTGKAGQYAQSPEPSSERSVSPDLSGGYSHFSAADSPTGKAGQYAQSPESMSERNMSPDRSGGYRHFSPADSLGPSSAQASRDVRGLSPFDYSMPSGLSGSPKPQRGMNKDFDRTMSPVHGRSTATTRKLPQIVIHGPSEEEDSSSRYQESFDSSSAEGESPLLARSIPPYASRRPFFPPDKHSSF